MIFPISIFAIVAETQPADVNSLLWWVVPGLFLIIGFMIVRYMNNIDRHYEKLEAKVDSKFEQFDSRMDSIEKSQVKILTKLGID
jgi:uncharacterized membrane-anchored protein YhcB (DUF1043 family)